MCDTVKLRGKLLLKSGGRCACCGKRVTKEDSTIEHVIPKSLGGSNEEENLVCLCEYCNKQRMNYDIQIVKYYKFLTYGAFMNLFDYIIGTDFKRYLKVVDTGIDSDYFIFLVETRKALVSDKEILAAFDDVADRIRGLIDKLKNISYDYSDLLVLLFAQGQDLYKYRSKLITLDSRLADIQKRTERAIKMKEALDLREKKVSFIESAIEV